MNEDLKEEHMEYVTFYKTIVMGSQLIMDQTQMALPLTFNIITLIFSALSSVRANTTGKLPKVI